MSSGGVPSKYGVSRRYWAYRSSQASVAYLTQATLTAHRPRTSARSSARQQRAQAPRGTQTLMPSHVRCLPPSVHIYPPTSPRRSSKRSVAASAHLCAEVNEVIERLWAVCLPRSSRRHCPKARRYAIIRHFAAPRRPRSPGS